MANPNRYSQIIAAIFAKHYRLGSKEVVFNREEIELAAAQLGIPLPKNLGDILYSFRYRSPLPNSIRQTAPQDLEWVIRAAGRSKYKMVLTNKTNFYPNAQLSETKIPDSTPGIISRYALSDEQALLAKVRYNRLIDIFTGLTCYSLQNHLRTTVTNIGQVEIDELYIGVDKKGVQYVLPVQAKGGKDKLGIVQIEQDFAAASEKFPLLVCKPIAAQFMNDGVIALFEFEFNEDAVSITHEKHYRLVASDAVSAHDLRTYQHRSE